ncbi:MAG: tetratricopeptide repeat protein, partial [Gammaproteobacteria bacterium]|nr:tetratricopeptide repeat protein [Gammaproteobacteria bacterium]
QIPVKKYPANFLRRVFATGILTLSGMGGVLGHMGDTDQSMSMHERAIALSEDFYGMDHLGPLSGLRRTLLTRYFAHFDDGRLSPDPVHIPIIEGYEQLLGEVGQSRE